MSRSMPRRLGGQNSGALDLKRLVLQGDEHHLIARQRVIAHRPLASTVQQKPQLSPTKEVYS